MNTVKRSSGAALCDIIFGIMFVLCALLTCAQTPDPTPPGPPLAADRPHLNPFPAEQSSSLREHPEKRGAQ